MHTRTHYVISHCFLMCTDITSIQLPFSHWYHDWYLCVVITSSIFVANRNQRKTTKGMYTSLTQFCYATYIILPRTLEDDCTVIIHNVILYYVQIFYTEHNINTYILIKYILKYILNLFIIYKYMTIYVRTIAV